MTRMSAAELKAFLDQKVNQFEKPGFIPSDPVSIPHLFTKAADIEISGFLAATLAWGQRVTILHNCRRLLKWMDHAPHEFILHFTESDLRPFEQFVHRTFQPADCLFYLRRLQELYRGGAGLRDLFSRHPEGMATTISLAGARFFESSPPARTRKHFPDPLRGSAAKRINMFLRWMVRNKASGVDFGIWTQLSPSELICPLDVHSGRIARKLGLLRRKQNDWKAAEELTRKLRKLNPDDPVRYDFALFGLGVFEKF